MLYATYFDKWDFAFGRDRVEKAVETAIDQYGEVPSLAALRSLFPQTETRQSKRDAEWEDLQRRKRDGEKFYTIADVLREFMSRQAAKR